MHHRACEGSFHARLPEGHELRAGMVDGYWTALAARQGVWVTAQLPPGQGEALFRELGNMRPSKSSLDRLSRELGERVGGASGGL